MNLKEKKDVKINTSKVSKAYVTDSESFCFEEHYRENMVYKDNKIEHVQGLLFVCIIKLFNHWMIRYFQLI